MTTAHNGRRTDRPPPLAPELEQLITLRCAKWQRRCRGQWKQPNGVLCYSQDIAIKIQLRAEEAQRIAEGEEE